MPVLCCRCNQQPSLNYKLYMYDCAVLQRQPATLTFTFYVLTSGSYKPTSGLHRAVASRNIRIVLCCSSNQQPLHCSCTYFHRNLQGNLPRSSYQHRCPPAETRNTILLADSRAKNFNKLDKERLYTYQPYYISKPGATIDELKTEFCELIEDVPKDNSVFFVKIAAGINNLTSKVNRKRAYEIAPSTATADDIIDELLKLRDEIKEVYPPAIVSFVTIAPVVFLKQLRYFQEQRKLRHPIYNEGDRTKFQGPHEETILAINKRIKELNHQEQSGIVCQTASWHSEVLRRQRGSDRLIPGALYDGIHPTENVARKWHKAFHQAISKEIKQHQDKN